MALLMFTASFFGFGSSLLFMSSLLFRNLFGRFLFKRGFLFISLLGGLLFGSLLGGVFFGSGRRFRLDSRWVVTAGRSSVNTLIGIDFSRGINAITERIIYCRPASRRCIISLIKKVFKGRNAQLV